MPGAGARHRAGCALLLVTLSAGAAARQAPQPGTAAGSPPAVILGQVVDALSGEPVAAATVTVTVRGASAGGAGAGPMFVAAGGEVRLLTGADGRFVVREVPVGPDGAQVLLSATAPGYGAGAYGQSQPGGPSQPFPVSAGTLVAQPRLRLWQTSSIAGVVTDERGEPLPGIPVRALRRTHVEGQVRLSGGDASALAAGLPGEAQMQMASAGLGGGAVSDDRGVYRISGLRPGDYVVMTPLTQVSTPAATMDRVARSVESGDFMQLMNAGLDLASSGNTILPAGIRVGDLMVGTQAGIMPLPGADQRWRVFATRYFPDAVRPSLATPVTLEAGEHRTGVDLALALVPVVSVSGVAIGPDGPAGNVAIRLQHADDPLAVGAAMDVAATTTRADGSFLMPAVPAGSYTLRALLAARPAMALPDLADAPPEVRAMMTAMAGASAGPKQTLFAELPIGLDRDLAGVTVALTAGATVGGRVVFDDPAAAPGFEGLQVRLAPIAVAWEAGPAMAQGHPVGADGTFRTSGLPPGRYRVLVQGRMPAGWFLGSAMANGRDGVFEGLTLDDRGLGNVVITLTQRRGTLSGSVQRAAAAPPAPPSIVIFPAAWREWIEGGMPQTFSRTVRATDTGAFTVAGLPPRDYLAVALPFDAVPPLNDPVAIEALAPLATLVPLAGGGSRSIVLSVVEGRR